MNYYITVLKNYAVFKGRARRAEYWWFVLISMLISGALSLGAHFFGFPEVISNVYSGLVFLPSLAVAIRRLHDADKSGWNYLWLLTIIGVFYLIYLLIEKGTPGLNQYGEDPKMTEVEH